MQEKAYIVFSHIAHDKILGVFSSYRKAREYAAARMSRRMPLTESVLMNLNSLIKEFDVDPPVEE